MSYKLWDLLSHESRAILKVIMDDRWNPELEDLAEIEKLIRKAARGKQAILTKGGKR